MVVGVAKIPGLDSAVTGFMGVMQAQAEALAALPGAVRDLSAAVRNLSEVTAGAKETVATLNRLTARMDQVMTELEEPLKALAPGMRTVATVLEDPVVATLPETLAQIQRDILPVLRTIADTNERVAFIAGSTERLVSFVDDTGRTLAGLPGAALLSRRRPTPKAGEEPG